MEPQTTQFLDLYRTGMRTAADVMRASLESVEKIQNQQLQVFRAAMEENVRLMDYCGGAWRAAGSQVQGAARSNTEVASAANQEKRPEPQRKSA